MATKPLPNMNLLGDTMFGPKADDPITRGFQQQQAVPSPEMFNQGQPVNFPQDVQSALPTAPVQQFPLRPQAKAIGNALGQMGAYAEAPSPPPIHGGITTSTPGGSSVTVPPMSPISARPEPFQLDAAQGRAGEINDMHTQMADKFGLVGEERETFLREQSQTQKTKEAKEGINARIGVEQIAKSLEERGMAREDIEKAIGFEKGMDYKDAFSGLKALQKREDAKLEGSEGDRRTIDKINQAATYDPETGEPTNDAGIMEGFINDFLGAGADPEGDALGSFLTKSQAAEFERAKTRISRGKLNKDDIPRLTRFKEQAMKKSQAKFHKREAKDVREKQEEATRNARKSANNAEERLRVGALDKQITAAQSDMDDLSYAGITEENQGEFDAAKDRRDNALAEQSRGTAVPPVDKALTPELATQFLTSAGGDRAKAEQMAKDAGYSF